ncbi:hypothetical protein AG1IA_03715 [Rhizoctonia solani AG-1 IA]|uniref:Uncharacterized protein n=1 Tax=Thanatephorus cucumeris (strain AG1-IA) TaxID=983506 RepID=L8X0W6_THACA|nr:hypothetical protein AG1IA_03715 [Rhizoctonia solani AG-1 IA]
MLETGMPIIGLIEEDYDQTKLLWNLGGAKKPLSTLVYSGFENLLVRIRRIWIARRALGSTPRALPSATPNVPGYPPAVALQRFWGPRRRDSHEILCRGGPWELSRALRFGRTLNEMTLLRDIDLVISARPPYCSLGLCASSVFYCCSKSKTQRVTPARRASSHYDPTNPDCSARTLYKAIIPGALPRFSGPRTDCNAAYARFRPHNAAHLYCWFIQGLQRTAFCLTFSIFTPISAARGQVTEASTRNRKASIP